LFDAAPALSKRADRRVLLKAGFDYLLGSLVFKGTLTLRYPDGTEVSHTAGAGPAAALEIKSWRAVRRVLFNPALAFGEAVMDGDIVPIDCRIYDVLDLLIGGRHEGSWQPIMRVRDGLSRLGKRFAQFNPASRARRNVAHHYDLNGQLYALLLDADRQYSCAYFRHGNETLDEAQVAKKRHIAAKLLLTRPGLRVLDIGCGWGGMALTLARDYGADVTGITLSQEQLETARARAAEAGLSDRVRFELIDYRAVTAQFDRIVSVGMFEHVGVNHYRHFFDVVARGLNEDGVALIHAIGRSRGPDFTNPWLAKYIFPGGYSPALSEVLPPAEKSGLFMTDLEILRLHYAKTLAAWRANLDRNRDAIRELYDERFCRMFEFYLSGAELAFRRSGQMVWQMQLAKRQQAVPLTRDYITE
jgi:cyclopropane-fatty-acyl-phospholipid synthase